MSETEINPTDQKSSGNHPEQGRALVDAEETYGH